jgi:hypothetical protein
VKKLIWFGRGRSHDGLWGDFVLKEIHFRWKFILDKDFIFPVIPS